MQIIFSVNEILRRIDTYYLRIHFLHCNGFSENFRCVTKVVSSLKINCNAVIAFVNRMWQFDLTDGDYYYKLSTFNFLVLEIISWNDVSNDDVSNDDAS